MGTSIAYLDVTESRTGSSTSSTSSKRELEQAYEELQSTVEELETTNEELQSTNEELETTNEELQSTNEELETMNEELQSSNEELETMNEELRHRTQEVNDVNAFLETILTTIGLAVAVLDRDQRVQIWNGKARELWGLTPEEAEDQHLLALDIGLPVEQAETAVTRHAQRTVRARGGRARSDQPAREAVSSAASRCLPLVSGGDSNVFGVIMMMEAIVRLTASRAIRSRTIAVRRRERLDPRRAAPRLLLADQCCSRSRWTVSRSSA